MKKYLAVFGILLGICLIVPQVGFAQNVSQSVVPKSSKMNHGALSQEQVKGILLKAAASSGVSYEELLGQYNSGEIRIVNAWPRGKRQLGGILTVVLEVGGKAIQVFIHSFGPSE